MSVRGAGDVTEALFGVLRVSPGRVTNLNTKIFAMIEEWRPRPVAGEHPCAWLDGVVMKRTIGRRGAQRLAVGGARRYREIPGLCEGATEGKSGWSGIRRNLV